MTNSKLVQLRPVRSGSPLPPGSMHRGGPAAVKVLIVTANRDRYTDLPAEVEWAADRLEAEANLRSMNFDHIFVDATLKDGREYGCTLIRKLRQSIDIKSPLWLVMDNPVPSDAQFAKGVGAIDVLERNHRVLCAVIAGDPVRHKARMGRTEPSWLHDVIKAMRIFIAIEADYQVKNVYTRMSERVASDVCIEVGDVVLEASLLLEDLDERRSFLKQFDKPRKK